ncbi:YybS family protein [Radiobacillus kanasensis]|uniref:YybS family protein n=1 Tax=Radiobacillus kanasensis TaxID=2844358 RepID=UPI001E336FE8|nr:YybS family protein [Radiobacillus kanasensis]UFT99400.1 YybS family protein [Radiobacillus kanasensis]
MNNRTQFITGLIHFAIYSVLLLGTMMVPAIELITVFVLPIPFLLFTSKYGWKSGLVFGLITVSFTTILLSVVTVPFSLVAAIGGTMIGESIHQKRGAYETWARGSLGAIVGIMLSFLFIQSVFSINIVEEIRQSIHESIETSEEMLSSFGLDSSEANMDLVLDQMLHVLDLLPVVIAVIGILLAFITQWIGYKVTYLVEKRKLLFPPFRQFRLPVSVVWFYFIGIVLMWFVTEDSGMMYQAAINISNLAGFLVTLQGLSFVFFYTHKKRLSKAIPVITIVIAVLFPFIGLYLVRILGIIDLGFGLRDLLSDEKKK